MAYKIVPPKKLHTTIILPGSKSISNRALILSALSLSNYEIENLSVCEDTTVITDAFASNTNVFDVRGAGTAMRFLAAFLACVEGEWILQGSKRMHERPIHPLVDTLVTLGAKIEYLEKKGYPPLKINGEKLQGGEVFLTANVSSQFISALLMIAPTMENGLTLHLEREIISRPYIHLTQKMMEDYGVKIKWRDNIIKVKPQPYVPTPYYVEPDWSAASYWYSFVALLPEAEVKLIGLKKESMQGDANIINLFSDLGVSTSFYEDGVILKKKQVTAQKFFHNFINEPDLAQTFTVTCCLLGIPFFFSGLQTLKIKETDRIEALITELKKLGYVLQETENGILEWDGERCLPDETVVIETYDDHRMAMSFAPASIKFEDMYINYPDVVAKSYPSFWSDLKQGGFKLNELENF
ncbi:MAG: 3-phosphoshikimate 1-carboxyvinyltransferase [Dysgonamonadaceae bacterium]|nr:3-phosphoshikimate 1-carboxyvinyltransferase [Dysgonamonadaceae bacterium]MDD4729763.1 3-phosphoshikimate 1-carboxyvinyltransferase [Dysgonamonadaceae bacterium]